MENLLNKLNAFFSYLIIPADKQLHLWTGLAGGFLLSILISAWAILFVAIFAAIKEYYDYHHPNIHTADVWDFVATTVGAVLGAAIWWVICSI